MSKACERLLQHMEGNNSREAAALANNSRNREECVFRLWCGNPLHTKRVLITSVFRSMRRGQGHPLYCRVCDQPPGAGRQGSSHEQRCYAMMQAHYPDVKLCLESMVLGSSSHSPVDLYMPCACMAVYVDGEHHFTSQGTAGHNQQGSTEQASRDAAINQAVARGDMVARGVKGMVRLHYADSSRVWQACVADGLSLARNPSVRCFVLFSPAYDKDRCVQYV